MDRVQRSRAKGAKLPEATLYCGRPTRRGNPFIAIRHGAVYAVRWGDGRWTEQWERLGLPPTVHFAKERHWLEPTIECARQTAMELYAYTLGRLNPEILGQIMAECRGHEHLSCFCPLDGACHVDYLLDCLKE